jgi:hypothetical protein
MNPHAQWHQGDEGHRRTTYGQISIRENGHMLISVSDTGVGLPTCERIVPPM